MERLSFISGSSANEEEEEEDEEDDEDPLAGLLPPPPLPPKPAILLNQQPRLVEAAQAQPREATPMIHGPSPHYPAAAAIAAVPDVKQHAVAHSSFLHGQQHRQIWTREPHQLQANAGEDSDGEHDGQFEAAVNVNTVRRRAKRERNRTTGAIVVTTSPKTETTAVIEDAAIKARTKARSKSRSPGRSIDDQQQTSRHPAGGGIIVGAPRGGGRGCAVHARGQSPDNISESSASFHENELVSRHSHHPHHGHHHQPRHHGGHHQHQHGGHHLRHVQPHQGSSSSSSSVPPPTHVSHASTASAASVRLQQFSNRDSVRDSWISSGGSANIVHATVSSGGTSDASNKSLPSSSAGGGPSRGHGRIASVSKLSQPQSESNTPHLYTRSVAAARHHGGSKGSLVGPAAASVSASLTSQPTTLPRSARRVQSATVVPQVPPQAHIYTKHQHQRPAYPSRSVSRESGSSSSRTVSRSGSRSGLRGASGSRSGSSTALQRQCTATEGKAQFWHVSMPAVRDTLKKNTPYTAR